MIEDYGFGRITVNGKTYHTDVIILPDRVIDSWWRKEGHNLCLEDLRDALGAKPAALVVGTGRPGFMKVPPALVEELTRQGIEIFTAPTEQAVREYNRQSREKRTVAALHLTC